MPAWKIALGELLSECLAVFIIIVIGCSAAGMYTLYDPSPYQSAYWGVCITWGLSVTIAIYVTGAVSGTHANPAVTLALALFRGFSWRKVLPYSAAQITGGFLGAAVVYLLYGPVIDHYNDLHHLTRAGGGAAGVFFTHPGLAISVMHAFVDEIVLTAMLVLGIIYQIAFMLELRRSREQLRRDGLIHGESEFPVSLTVIVAVMLLAIGVMAVVSMVYRVGPFGGA